MTTYDDDYWRFAKERDTVYDNVKTLLEQYPETREDYRMLLFYYWHFVDRMISVLPKQLTGKLSSPESITRTFRQVIHDNPRLAPTPKTQKARDKQLDRMSQYYREEARKEHLRGDGQI